MHELIYSNDAINVLDEFHRVDAMVFVEGDEDIPFWEFLFNKFTDLSVCVESVGGKPRLEQYVDDIFTGKSKVIVAMDKDHSLFDKSIKHPNILFTYGYSIENTIISSGTIHKAIRSLGRVSRRLVSEDEITIWLSEFSNTIKPILMFDIGNHVHQHGYCVAGSDCSRFMTSKTSHVVCGNIVSRFLDDLEFEISEDEQKHYLKAMNNASVSVLDAIRGHFLFSAVHRFVISYIKRIRSKISISHESMFAAILLSFEQMFNEKHTHYKYYKSVLSDAYIESYGAQH